MRSKTNQPEQSRISRYTAIRRMFWCCLSSPSSHEVEKLADESTKVLDEKYDYISATAAFVKAYENKTESDIDIDSNATTADTALSISTQSQSPALSLKTLSRTGAPEDFSGSWTCVKVTGDMERFLTDMRLSEQLRKAAGAANYGIGRQFQNIAQVGNSFVIQNILKAPVTMRFNAGAGVQTSVDQEGSPIAIDPYWEGSVLCVTSKRESGELIANTRRSLEGSLMVLELESPGGTKVRRSFEKR